MGEIMKNKNINLCITTDVHGAVFSRTYHDQQLTGYGLARASSAVKAIRKTGECLLIDNGDFLQGSPFSSYVAEQLGQPQIMADLYKDMHVDYCNLGNHDFNYGEKYLLGFLENNNSACLCGNVLYQGKPLGKSVLYTSESGKTIALIGVVTQYIPQWEQPDHIQHMTFINAFDYVRQEIERLRPLADYTAVIYHGGLENDPVTNLPTERHTKENLGSRMIQEIPGIDVLITGHQHRSINTFINNTLVMQCAMSAAQMMHVTIDTATGSIQGELLDLSQYPIDEAFLAPYQPIEDQVQSFLDKPLGTLASGDLLITDQLEARVNKHPLVSFTNQMQWFAAPEADLSASALFNLPVGFHEHVTLRDIVSNYIYPNTFVVKEISGKTLKDYLEKNARFFALDNAGNIIINPEYIEPKLQLYNYDMVDGIDYEIIVSHPEGSRISNLSFKQRPVKDEDVFTIVMNNYRGSGGGDFSMIESSRTIREIQESMVDLIEKYFQIHPLVEIHHEANIKVVK